MTGCRAEVEAILQSRGTHRGGVPGHEVARRLALLPAECRDDVRAAARNLLTGLPETSEGDFAVALDALVLLDDPDVGDLAAGAIRNPFALVKEDYVSTLEDLDERDRAVTALLDVLNDGSARPDRPDLTTTIRALHALQADEALAAVARYVGHGDVAVRGSAAMFLYDFDESGAVGAAAFTDQLGRETEAAMLELLIDGLRRWKVQPDEALLARLSGDSSIPHSLRESVRAAQTMGRGNR